MARKSILGPAARLTLGLIGLATSMVFIASTLGFLGDKGEKVESRKQLSESLAIGFSSLAQRTDAAGMKRHFDAIVERNPHLLSVGLRKPDKSLLFTAGDHPADLVVATDAAIAEAQFSVPVFNGDVEWGALECHFAQTKASGWWGVVDQPEFRLAGFLALTCGVLFYGYLRFVMRKMTPSKVVPGRVRDALDTLAEGLIVVGRKEKIVMANRAFQRATGLPLIELIGQSANTLPFSVKKDPSGTAMMPWTNTIQTGDSIRGAILEIDVPGRLTQTFSVSSTPIMGEGGIRRGAMVSLEDVSQLETQRKKLDEMVQTLEASGEKITQQNRELEVLATRDVLTGCLNRRSFLNQFEHAWSRAKQKNQPLSAVMVDIDYFKAVNDNHGHATGDEVLQQVSRVLRETSRKTDIVSRYGGEEFSIVMPRTNLADATQLADQLRAAIAELEFSSVSITASFGVSALCQHPSDTQDLLEQADKSLYFAKRNGRNQVASWDKVAGVKDPEPDDMSDGSDHSLVPFGTVTGLFAALAFRDQETASHSRRVADLCIEIGEGLISKNDGYLLEVAGLMHDIGIIGVPDSILLKPDRLSEEELQIMKQHERVGVEIVKRSFESDELACIIHHSRLPFFSEDAMKPSGTDLLFGARILAVANAYDAMTSDRVFQDGMEHECAMEELRNDPQRRFDPQLIDRLEACIAKRATPIPRCLESVTRDAALSIGLQLEGLSAAIDENDSEGVMAMARRLSSTAEKHGVADVAATAASLAEQSAQNLTEDEFISTACDLLDLCRATQSVLIEAPTDSMTV